MRFIVCLGTAACLAAAFTLGASARSDGRAGCSNATLNGAYSLRATGDVLGIGPFAAVGVFNFDGNGHVSVSLVTRTNGANGVSNVTGAYVVAPDCTAADTLSTATGVVSTHSYAIFGGGRGFYILNTTVGAPNVIIGEARRQTGKGDNE